MYLGKLGFLAGLTGAALIGAAVLIKQLAEAQSKEEYPEENDWLGVEILNATVEEHFETDKPSYVLNLTAGVTNKTKDPISVSDIFFTLDGHGDLLLSCTNPQEPDAVLSPDDITVLSLSFQSKQPIYGEMRMSVLHDKGNVAVRFRPSHGCTYIRSQQDHNAPAIEVQI